jgi:hypothetical protein
MIEIGIAKGREIYFENRVYPPANAPEIRKKSEEECDVFHRGQTIRLEPQPARNKTLRLGFDFFSPT